MKDMSGNNLKIIVMGPVGSGKSTQADLLAKHLKVPHLEMGEILREMASQDESIRKIVESGSLVTDEVVLGVLADELAKEEYKSGFVIDGVPRTIEQASNLPFVPDLVIYLRVRDSENIKRLLKRGRMDDTEEIIKDRLNIYHQQTSPILDFYRQRGKLLEIDGEPPIKVISQDIFEKLKLK